MTGLPDQIGGEVRRAVKGLGPSGNLGPIVDAWPSAVGAAIAANAWPARVSRDGTLHVAVASSAWAFELTQLEKSVAERLREHVGEAAPACLRFAVGPLPEPGAEGVETSSAKVPRPSAAETAEAKRMAAGIADRELREAVAKAAAASLAAARSPRADRSVW